VLAEDQHDERAQVYREAGHRGEHWRRALIRGASRMPREARDMLDAALDQPDADA
jgi:hypothetical protein